MEVERGGVGVGRGNEGKVRLAGIAWRLGSCRQADGGAGKLADGWMVIHSR